MKSLYLIAIVTVFAITMVSCSKTKVTPSTPSKVDTSKTLISDIRLVGNWNIVTDTISFQGNNIMYHGIPTDHYKFTKYGNLYIKQGLGSLIDTAIYGISSITNQVAWVNQFVSVNGVSTTTASSSLSYSITSLDSVKLVLTQNGTT